MSAKRERTASAVQDSDVAAPSGSQNPFCICTVKTADEARRCSWAPRTRKNFRQDWPPVRPSRAACTEQCN